MWQTNRRKVLAMGTSAAALAMLGADGPKLPFARKEQPLKGDETIGDLAYVRSKGEVRVEGVGLVVGLEGTGSDPEPSRYREKLLAKMRAAMVRQSEKVLASRNNSLVIVRGVVPVGITKADTFDIDVELTPGSSTTSLEGGVLLKTELTQVSYVQGQELEGKVLGSVAGPVVTGRPGDPSNVKVGRILGGARVRYDIPYLLIINENRKNVKTAAVLQAVVARRFFRLDGVEQKGMAEAKTDQTLELGVPQIYHQNQPRFFQVLQLLPIVETPELRASRLEQWGKDLLDPKKAGVAALRLEGLGSNAIETLKKGLESPEFNVRFFSAEALAYLGDASGADILARTAVERSEFRAFALAALAASDQVTSVARLRELLGHPEVEVRYGAFNALRTLDENDVFLGKVRVLDDEVPAPSEDDSGDAMAYQIAVARARRNRVSDPFSLYLVESDGPPLIHVSNTRRSEIVVFGRRQRLLPPMVLGDPASVMINASPDDQAVQITRIAKSGTEVPDQHVTSRLEVGEVIREASNLGATYPQIVAILRAAQAQRNLEGPLVVDALPGANLDYDKAQLAGQGAKGEPARKDESVERASGETKTKAPRFRVFERFRSARKKAR
jgi:flagellar basal body P-ring protein FlgI